MCAVCADRGGRAPGEVENEEAGSQTRIPTSRECGHSPLEAYTAQEEGPEEAVGKDRRTNSNDF